ncbi:MULTISPECIES: universal stress protein [Catenuloplanes]|uniref:Nucleotide-binding universal stress UspA family protein n=1 Tax=Catenuloplanes niger TaxID=587534 RepID=A0AAE4CXL1_9ACTN|nr:universal stress protein [Catenuloplanes niger]MDR7327612.1 nucleotide-binding universal stress UspA family protein [Catenuloplanes niger]
MKHSYLITVGVDGSDGGRRALDWAVREAVARGGAVRAVSVWLWDGYADGAVVGLTPREQAAYVTEVLHRDIEDVTRRYGSSVPITAEVVEGTPAAVLTTAARDGDLLVLGSHGHGRIRHGLLGSVSESCIHAGPCPVVVIPVPAPAGAAAA